MDDGVARFVFRLGFLADAIDDGAGGPAFVVEVWFEAVEAVVAESGDIDVAAGDDDGGGEWQGAEGQDEGGGDEEWFHVRFEVEEVKGSDATNKQMHKICKNKSNFDAISLQEQLSGAISGHAQQRS